jgi:uncharacterized protein with NAD-binding domain and iron-sulfur cluster
VGPIVSPSGLPKVVVLGGGIAGLTAAYELSRGEWWQRYSSIVVYQQGWRLGGKAASGRDFKQEHRIEEHGLHIWFGYYENAFRMLAGCHDELDAIAADAGDSEWRRWSPAMTRIDQGFHPCNTIGLADDEPDGTWTQWLASFPESDASPWDRDIVSEPMAWDLSWYLDRIGQRIVALAHTAIRSLVEEVDLRPLTLEPEPEDRARLVDPILLLDEVLGRLDPVARRFVDATVAAATSMRLLADRVPDDPIVRLVLAQIDAADTVLDYLRVRYDEPIRWNATLRRMMTVLDLFLGVTRGLLAHRIVTEDDLDALDDWEWDEWLASQGVRIESRESTLVRGLSYALPFAYFQGSRDNPIFSAGVGLRLFLRSFFTYRGALMWKPNAGMGDVVFSPLFELLVKRGVDIHFFHQVDELEVDDDARRVTGINLRRQRSDATPPQDKPERLQWFRERFLRHRRRSDTTPAQDDSERLQWYRERFLKAVRPRAGAGMADADLQCWPNQPLPIWDPGPTDFGYEDLLGVPSHAGDPAYVPIARDDVVVLALPLGVIAHVGTQLLRDARWKAQVEEVGLVPTQSAQLWLKDRCSTSLGWPDDLVASGFTEPFDTFADMPVASRTEEAGLGAETVVYLCGVLFDPPSRPDGPTYKRAPSDAGKSTDAIEREWLQRERRWARKNLLRFLTERAAYLWPQAVDPSTGLFDPATLADPKGSNYGIAQGFDNLYDVIDALLGDEAARANPAAPYFRANVQPSDRYVLSLPGTARYRLAPGDSGFGNLFPAGDWTACVLDAGCMEAATISGMLAAEAITGEPRTIIGRQAEPAFAFGEDRGEELYWSTT